VSAIPKAATGKRLPRGGAGIAEEAIRRLLDRGVEPSVRGVVAELKRWRLVGMSFREAAAVLREWRRQHLAENSGLLETAEVGILALDTNVLRDELTRRIREATDGQVEISFNVKARIKRAKTGMAQKRRAPAK